MPANQEAHFVQMQVNLKRSCIDDAWRRVKLVVINRCLTCVQ